jgi:predicted nuclease of predicted toxin-antitoxin system
VRLLLDEGISAVVAGQLRGRDRGVEAASERRELRGLPDLEVFEYAQSAERSVVTYNREDFLELDRRYRGQHRSHSGIVILNPRRFPQGNPSLGPLVMSLDRLITEGSPYESFIQWLQ